MGGTEHGTVRGPSKETQSVGRHMSGKGLTSHKIFSHWKIINTNILPGKAIQHIDAE
jgi:hypothetical protein